ncbi:hypothetical protein J2X46_002351 [Nocardioides sp. BE266]|uniref:DUF4365 domain-containing protein n=1 Tax=Nocardioides sp. BE266 TaxID=2817725 RepID=UPI002861A5B4|nr:DUF4365 domain-containing protein [Nocardioides sp. BE266]MDR7253366.1 hypothetical protein [Nocardioides sp. BE266]
MSTTRGKMIDANSHKGDAGIALIHRRVSQMKHLWHERSIDPGIDGTIELRDPSTGEVSNQHIFVQSKASDAFAGETEAKFHYICKQRDVDYWMKAGDNPVILICSHPDTGEAWWVHIQSWFADPSHRASLRVDFDKATQRFEGDIAAKLFAITDPHGRAHTPVVDGRSETLVSNLLPVDFPDTYFTAQVAPGTTLRDVFVSQRATGKPFRRDFFVSHQRIYAWSPIAGTSLARIAITAANETPVGELLAGTDDERRLFVRLLSAALQHDLLEVCDWSNARKFLYFRASSDLSERKVLSGSGRSRIAFKGFYQRKDDPTLKQFYRHAALRWDFVDIGEEWHCQATPDYYFSSDGRREAHFADDYLARLKRMERNPAVLGETQLWAGILRGEAEPTLLPNTSEDRILTFGPLATFDITGGIDDKDWQAPVGGDDNPDQMAFDFEDHE